MVIFVGVPTTRLAVVQGSDVIPLINCNEGLMSESLFCISLRRCTLKAIEVSTLELLNSVVLPLVLLLLIVLLLLLVL